LDIGVLGYIGIVWPKEHSPEVWSVPPVTPCIWSSSLLEENPANDSVSQTLVHSKHGEIVMKTT